MSHHIKYDYGDLNKPKASTNPRIIKGMEIDVTRAWGHFDEEIQVMPIKCGATEILFMVENL